MPTFSLTKRVAAPVEIVFDVATDLANAAEHIRGIDQIELLTPPPVGLGTKWRETRKMMGHASTETLEITAFDRPRGYTIGCESCGVYFESTFRFAPVGDETEITLDVRMEARTLMAKFMSPLGDLMFGSTMRQCMDNDLDDIKRVAEQRVAAR
jgi:hypothetical protein